MGDGGEQEGPPTNFSPVTSTNVGISPQNFFKKSILNRVKAKKKLFLPIIEMVSVRKTKKSIFLQKKQTIV